MKRVNYWVVAFIVLLILVGIYFGVRFTERTGLIGGNRDSHGCLVAAGYSWDRGEGECVRKWLNRTDPDRYQVTDFISCTDAGYPVGESYPRQCWTPSGRRFVEIIEATAEVGINIESSEIEEK